ncbi:MAG: hypothetical protein ACLSGS_07865 [Adlercreutzia sp.]
MSSNVTRRSFFKGAGLAAMGALTAGTLSGCGQGYAAATPANPSAGDFGGPSWLEPPVIDEADIAETIDTEVLVVGMGTGGIPAMISAAENGARVLGIDRQGTPHNVREDIGAIDSRLQQASFDEFPEFRIEKKEAVEGIVRYANGVNYDLVKLWADESGAMVDCSPTSSSAMQARHGIRGRRATPPTWPRQGLRHRPQSAKPMPWPRTKWLRRVHPGLCRRAGRRDALVLRVHQVRDR